MRPENPRLLILETSERVGQVGLAEGEVLLSSRELDHARRHARDLVPAIKEMLKTQAWCARDLHGVVVSRGPGSYTGLRVGLISAKSLAYAAGSVFLAIDTFEAIACQVASHLDRVAVVADAQQAKLYVQDFIRTGASEWTANSELAIKPLTTWLANRDHSTWITGPGLRSYGDQLGHGALLVDPAHWNARVTSLLQLGLARYRRQEADDFWIAEPLYLRASSAEEEWQGRSAPVIK